MTAPDKLVLVPVDPTEAMLTAGHASGVAPIWTRLTHEEALDLKTKYLPRAYATMIASAPAAPDPMREKMMKVLEPFAKEARAYVNFDGAYAVLHIVPGLTVADLRRADALLAELTAQSEKEK